MPSQNISVPKSKKGSRPFNHQYQKKYPKSTVVTLKNGVKKDAGLLAMVITHPIFQIDNRPETKDQVVDWFLANVNRNKTSKETQRYFLILAWNNLDNLKRKNARELATELKAFEFRTAKHKGWRTRIDEFISHIVSSLQKSRGV